MQYCRNYIHELQETLNCLPFHIIEKVVSILHDARLSGHQVFIMGNGGSASTASHFVCDLAKNTRREDFPNFRVIGLADNMAILSALANDEGYENVFVAQMANLLNPGDIVIGISTSGNSKNVLNALDLAREKNAITIGFTGFDGGQMSSLLDFNIHVPSYCIERVEDIHLMLEHMICMQLREQLKDPISPLREKIENESENGRIPSVSPTFYLDGVENLLKKDPAVLLEAITHELVHPDGASEIISNILQILLSDLGANSGNMMFFYGHGELSNSFNLMQDNLLIHHPDQVEDIIRNGLAGWVKQNGTGALVMSTLNDPRWLQRSWEKDSDTTRSAISVPIIFEKNVVGVVTLVSNQAEHFSVAHLSSLTHVAANISPENSSDILT